MTAPATHELFLALAVAQQAMRALEEAQRSREEFLGRMSHEFRTPLNAVIGFSRLLEKNPAGNQRPEDIHLLSRVRASGERLLQLVENVLDQSRIERGRLDLDVTDVSVTQVVSRVVETYRPRAVAKGLAFFAVIPECGPVPLDGGRFENTLRHLLDNALKFTASGSVNVHLLAAEAPLRPARLVITDTGIGMSPEQLERVFEPFEQARGGIDREFDGAGLGLSLARQVCEAMGCMLAVESRLGAGTRVTIRFP